MECIQILAMTICLNLPVVAPPVPPVVAPPPAPLVPANITWSGVDGVAGYKIYYGLSVDAMTNVIEVPGAGSVSYVIPNMPTGSYFFGVVSYDDNMIESDLSPLVNVEF